MMDDYQSYDSDFLCHLLAGEPFDTFDLSTTPEEIAEARFNTKQLYYQNKVSHLNRCFYSSQPHTEGAGEGFIIE